MPERWCSASRLARSSASQAPCSPVHNWADAMDDGVTPPCTGSTPEKQRELRPRERSHSSFRSRFHLQAENWAESSVKSAVHPLSGEATKRLGAGARAEGESDPK